MSAGSAIAYPLNTWPSSIPLPPPRVRISIISFPHKESHSSFPSNLQRRTKNSKPAKYIAMSSLMDKAKGFVADHVAKVKIPEASLTDVSVKRLGRDGASLNGEVSVDNPYSHKLPICELSYTLKSADRIVASGKVMDPGWIEASGSTKLQVPFKVPYDFLMSLLRDIGRDWDIDYVFHVGLTIDLPIVGNFTIPLSTKGELKFPSISDFFSGGEEKP